MPRVVGGICELFANGEKYLMKGDWRYNLGGPKRTAVIGEDSVHGYMEAPQVPYFEGEITDTGGLDIASLVRITDATVILRKPNGKSVVLSDAWYAADGNAQTREGNIEARFEGLQAQEVAA